MAQANRPLSPHLGIYRWQVSNTLSILHRMSGMFLTLGALVLTAWLVAAASGASSYGALLVVLKSPLGMLALFGWSLAFFYHLCNGIRHLCWDAGWGFTIPGSRATGWTAVITACALTLVFWVVVLTGSGS